MPIVLRCACGHQQTADPELAGRTTPCTVCGLAIAIPAMGKLASEKSRPRRPKRESTAASSQATGIAAIAVGAVFVFGATAWLIWALTREIAAPAVQVVENNVPVETPPKPKTTEPEKKSTPIPPIEVKDPPRVVEQPAKSDPPRPIGEPVGDPVKPKDPPKDEKTPIPVIEPLKLVWKLKHEDVFYQELIVTQKPTFKVQGVAAIESFLQYRIVSRMEVKKRREDGSLQVEQKIESARLVQADDLSRQTIEAAVGKLPGATYKLELNAAMEVTKFEGGPGGVQLGGFPVGGGMGLQTASLLDRDGWKELHQSTFFQLNDTPKLNTRWSKPMAHAWGALGGWNGKIQYVYAGMEKDLHKITYTLQLAYSAPKGGAIGLMTVNGANFQAPTAGGALLFDAQRGKVVAVEERFRVKGLVNVNLLGQNTGIQIDEDQHFLIRIHDKLNHE